MHNNFDRSGGFIMNVLHNEKGQGLTEYALIIALVAIVAVAALTLLGGQIDAIFGNITTELGG
ncbi:MAG TPA: Flp family type IVb pilin [Firmicutes bacterium]|nr:Flp family type IVb pilin [Bacillota bacterium]